MSGLKRESSGALNWWSFGQTNPTAQSGWVYYPTIPVADPTNHLAVAVYPEYEPPFGNVGPTQLASYTVSTQGNLVSTNTWKNMPTPSTGVSVMNMSPSGKLLAVGGAGLLVYHFNGASPITSFSAKLTTAAISALHWDNANHLYALSQATGKLYVFTITPTSITSVSGSPYTIAGSNGLFVVPK
jgi:hypothetical protein